MKHRRALVALFTVAVIILSAPAALADSDPRSDQSEQLVGSWSATFTPAPGDPSQFPPLPALFSFTRDGIVIETDGGSLAAPSGMPFGYGSPGQGAWRQTAARKFAVTFLIIIVNMDGTLQATGKVQLNVTADRNGDSFRGTGHYTFTLPDGTVVASGNELVSGTRVRP